MRKVKTILAIAPGCLIAALFSGNLFADMSDLYVGLDVLKTNYSTQERYGRNVFAKNPVAFNAFVGYKLPRNFFVEAGYEMHETKHKTAGTVGAGEYMTGESTPLAAGEYVDFNSKTNLEHPYVGVGYDYNLPKFSEVTLSALAGISATKLKASYEIIETDEVRYVTPLPRDFSKRALAPLLKISLNYQFSQHVGMRLIGEWHGMSTFKIKPKQANTNPETEIRAKNGYAAGLGIIYQF